MCNKAAGAARELNLSQSSILAAIDLAEEDAGARIFDRRKGRGVVTTAVGERYLAAASRLLTAEREFRHTLRADKVPRSPLRIGCFEPFGPIMVSVRSDCTAADRVGRIVSTLDSGHYGVLGGSADETALD